MNFMLFFFVITVLRFLQLIALFIAFKKNFVFPPLEKKTERNLEISNGRQKKGME